ncbi:MAG TPA: hypothetical protein VIF40_15635 [Methylosinus sp.]|uniref:hypothetical protein n=1 Tax=Methylosinus sp. TaxID=427 RepID=UPI002F920680
MSYPSLYPSANQFVGIDIGNVGALGPQWAYAGTPGNDLRPNTVSVIGENDGGTYPNNIPKLQIGLPQKAAPDIIITGHDALSSAGGDVIKPINGGMFRVCYYIASRIAGSAGSWSLGLEWNDGVSQAAVINSVSAATANLESDGCRTVYNVSGNTIGYSVVHTGTVGSPTFDLHMTVERLN